MRRMWEHFTIPKSVGQIGPNSGKMERTAGGNRRRRTGRSSRLLRHSTDLRFEGVLLRQAYFAGESSDWANYLEKKSWELASSAYGQV